MALTLTPEGKVKLDVKKYLNSLNNCWYYMPVNTHMRGIPDFVGCLNGKFFSIETKAEGKKPTDLQLDTHDEIRKAKGLVFVIVGRNDLSEFIHWSKNVQTSS